MTEVFADTSYYVALFNSDDAAHDRAVAATSQLAGPVITSAWILAQLGGHLADPPNREMFVDLVRDLRRDPNVVIVPPDPSLFDSALDLYARRPDKAWSFVDCTSFCIMRDRGIAQALTTDHHFEQAGFHTLLK